MYKEINSVMVSNELDADVFSSTECHLFYFIANISIKYGKKHNSRVFPFWRCKSQLTLQILPWHLFISSFLGSLKRQIILNLGYWKKISKYA